MRGTFLVIDGPNGSGKSSVAQATAARLRNAGVVVRETREPSDGPIGRVIRKLEGRSDNLAFACLIASDRYAHVANVISPALLAGVTVICDRYLSSSIALQVLDGVTEEQVLAFNQWTPQPDLYVVLLANPEVLAKRLSDRESTSDFEHRFTRLQEVDAFQRTASLLSKRGARVLVLDTSNTSIDSCVSLICQACGYA